MEIRAPVGTLALLTPYCIYHDFRYQALEGNLLAITLLDGMEDALQRLIDENASADIPKDESIEDAQQRILNEIMALDADERKDYANIFSTPFPEEMTPSIEKLAEGERLEHMEDVPLQDFYYEPSFCHSAILPSEARFQGLITENTTAVGRILDQNYEIGPSLREISNLERPKYGDPTIVVSPHGDDQILLATDAGGRQDCEENLNLDYKDFFVVTNREGWRTLSLPNDSESKVYTEFDGANSKGYVLVCLVRVSASDLATPCHVGS